jgi:thioesterase domain-containing protein
MIDDKYKPMIPQIEGAISILKSMGVAITAMRDGYAKIMMPIEPNRSHINTVYAGSLFSLAEFSGGVIFFAAFDHTRYYPIAKAMSIQYRKPATGDVSLEVSLTREQAAAISAAADEKGKADFSMDLEIKNEDGAVACTAQGVWQIRKWPGK